MIKGLGGLGGLGDMGKMMKAAQEMQKKMGDLQQELEAITVDRRIRRGPGQGHRHRQGHADRAAHRPLDLLGRGQGGGRGPDPRRHQGRPATRPGPHPRGDGKLTEELGLPPGHDAPRLLMPGF
jgi:hypothetical protein